MNYKQLTQEQRYQIGAYLRIGMKRSEIAKEIKVSEISYPDYLPKGEFRIDDPDGYCVMVAQAGPNTP